MDMQQVFTLMERFDASPLTGLEVALEGGRVKLEKSAGAGPASAAPASSAPLQAQLHAPAPAPELPGSLIPAPLVGTFSAAPAPGEAPFAPVGASVRKGGTVCVLEAMKMMSQVPAPFDCVIEEVLRKDGELAEFGAPLFRVREL